MDTNRTQRRFPQSLKGDQRGEFERDRDRILYCSAFRRLAGVTQVVGPAEGHIFHTRLTHSLKVSQLCRRLAQKLLRDHEEAATALGGTDPEVAEAAGLAHDLGHPPFGHIGEQELDRLATDNDNKEGFEGNAQSFRIVTRLSVRLRDEDQPPRNVLPGLNLTWATLDGILKYPWFRAASEHEHDKFGAYRTESDDFKKARSIYPANSRQKSLAAQIMDLADTITYSIHDLEDFYRVGFIALDRLLREYDKSIEKFASGEAGVFFDATFKRWLAKKKVKESEREGYLSAFHEVIGMLSFLGKKELWEPYQGTYAQRARLRNATSVLVSHFVRATRIDRIRGVEFENGDYDKSLRVLKELTWHYVILNPALCSKQHGERELLRGLFEILLDAAFDRKQRTTTIFPIYVQETLSALTQENSGRDLDRARVRAVIDFIASMTEQEAVRTHRRLTGTAGSVMDRF